jgi:hypothetical protein
MEGPNNEPRIGVEIVEVGVVRYDPLGIASDGGVNELVVVLIESNCVPAVRWVNESRVAGASVQEIAEARPGGGPTELFEDLLVLQEDVVRDDEKKPPLFKSLNDRA